MKIENGKIVSMNYTLKDLSGKVLESTNEGKPFEFLCGKNMVVPGLERELIGLQYKAGDVDSAIACYTLSINQNPMYVNSYIQRGLIFFHRTEYKK